MPNFAKSLIQFSKINRKLNKIEEASNYIQKAYDVSLKINLNHYVNESSVEQKIINMYKEKNSKDLLQLVNTASSKLGNELVAYIHYNLWEYDKLESSKKLALDLYTDLYKKYPKKIYKDYIDNLS